MESSKSESSSSSSSEESENEEEEKSEPKQIQEEDEEMQQQSDQSSNEDEMESNSNSVAEKEPIELSYVLFETIKTDDKLKCTVTEKISNPDEVENKICKVCFQEVYYPYADKAAT